MKSHGKSHTKASNIFIQHDKRKCIQHYSGADYHMYTSNCERALKFCTEVPHKVKKIKIERDTLENDVFVDVSTILQKFHLQKTLAY